MLLPPRILALIALFAVCTLGSAAEPLHSRIDELILGRARGKPVSPLADDAEFLRRVYLDLAGTIPPVEKARAFLNDPAADKRARLVDQLLASPEYPRRMQEAFHVLLMERLGDHADWTRFLHDSFTRNRPWNEMTRDMLVGQPAEPVRGAAFFLSKRLENYGQNPVDHPALARDLGRLFLGKDLRCAQCHDHLFVKGYKQADFQGLFAFIQNAYLADAATLRIGEKPLGEKTSFQSVFGKGKQEIGPRVPGGKEIVIPKLAKTEQFLVPPDRKTRAPGKLRFSPLAELAREIPTSPDFARNIVNRLWWLMLGRGLVHPLDLHHADNPASHPELLDLLAREFVAHGYDVKWLLREIARTKTYQRSSLLPEGVAKLQPESFLTAIEKRLSPEQLLWASLEATGMRESIESASKEKPKPLASGKVLPTPLEQARARFVRAFSGAVREPEDEFVPSLKGALFLLNDPSMLAWFLPRPGNLTDRLGKLSDDGKVAEELYLSVLSRHPVKEERDEVAAYLKGKTGKARPQALARLAWALLASTEFVVNH